jgi:23S rRNA pseudouridine2605 synthase
VSAARKKKGEVDRSREPVVAGLVRLNKYLADHGVASRRRCDELIAEGKVTVDGAPATQLGTKVDPAAQRIEVDGYVLEPEDLQKRYYLLNKPTGVVCTNEARETRPRAVDLITDRKKGRIYTVGRLDEDSSGLILLTNDGDFANRVMHPRHGVPKTYAVKVVGRIDEESLDKVKRGVHLAEGRTSGMQVRVHRRTPTYSQLFVTLREGMNREIRRSFARVGFKVVDLRRTNIGSLNDRGLKEGRWRPLTRREVQDLLEWTDGGKAKERPRTGRRAATGARERRPKRKGVRKSAQQRRTRR